MANPTTNFNWQMPTSSDLVTDLPADFEVFGQAVDTSLADLKGGTTGQVLSKASNTDMDFTWVAQDDSNAIQNAIVDAKGDLIAASAADVPARLAVGTDGQVLTADSTTATGLKWNTASSGGLTLISTTTLTGSSISLSSIPATYTNLQLIYKNAYASADAAAVRIRFNSDTGTNYGYSNVHSENNNAAAGYYTAADYIAVSELGTYTTTSLKGSGVIDVYRYTDTDFITVSAATYTGQARSVDGTRTWLTNGMYKASAAVSSMTVYLSTGTFSGGTLYLYGVK